MDTTEKSPSDKQILIQIQQLTKSFMVGETTVQILHGINLEIRKGEFVIIFGPSGCGKSTLLHTILGLEHPTEGKVLMGGHDYYAMNEDERGLYRRHNVGMIYQQSLWINSLKVNENVGFPLQLLGYDEDKIDAKVKEVLTIVGMLKWYDYTPTELSSGQQQKINLARALIIDPLIIVADEPTGNLDTVSGRELLETFMKLREMQKTIIMVTHDLEYLKYATKIYHMVDGIIVEELSPQRDAKTLEGYKSKKEVNGRIEDSDVRDKAFLDKFNK